MATGTESGALGWRGRTIESPRWRRAFLGLLALTILAFGALEGIYVISLAFQHPEVTPGLDFRIYQERTASFLAGDGFYRPEQLTGEPYPIVDGQAFYPPVILWLLVPFQVLPAILWWLVPLAVIAGSLWRLWPAPWAWPLLALVLVYPRTWAVLVYGNPSMWALAAVFAGAAWRWPGVFALIKPTLAPFALLDVRSRGWWLGLGVLAVLSLPFLGLWADYAVALLNAENPRGLEYTLGEWPIALAAVAAWLARDRGGEATPEPDATAPEPTAPEPTAPEPTAPEAAG